MQLGEKLRTSMFRVCVFSWASLPESQWDGNIDFLKLLKIMAKSQKLFSFYLQATNEKVYLVE